MSTPKPIGPPQAAPAPPRGVPVAAVASFPVAAQAAPIAVQPPRAYFRCREYPMLSVSIVVLYLLAALAIVNMIAAIWLALASLATAGLTPLAAAVVIGLTVIMHLSAAASLMASAEIIRVILDIQRNTQETAFNSRRIN